MISLKYSILHAFKMYADNLTIYASINNDNDRIELQNELDLFRE